MVEQISNLTKKSDKELESIKREILGEIKSGKKKRSLNFGSVLVSGVLVVLTIFSVVQTVQSATILQKIKSGAVKPARAGSALPSSVKDLPNMVGGC